MCDFRPVSRRRCYRYPLVYPILCDLEYMTIPYIDLITFLITSAFPYFFQYAAAARRTWHSRRKAATPGGEASDEPCEHSPTVSVYLQRRREKHGRGLHIRRPGRTHGAKHGGTEGLQPARREWAGDGCNETHDWVRGF